MKSPLNHHYLLKSTTKNHWNRKVTSNPPVESRNWPLRPQTAHALWGAQQRHPTTLGNLGAKSMGFPIVFPINKANPMAVSLVFPKKHVGFSQLYPSSSIFQGVPSPWFSNSEVHGIFFLWQFQLFTGWSGHFREHHIVFTRNTIWLFNIAMENPL